LLFTNRTTTVTSVQHYQMNYVEENGKKQYVEQLAVAVAYWGKG
jgi:hypothetical protein